MLSEPSFNGPPTLAAFLSIFVPGAGLRPGFLFLSRPDRTGAYRTSSGRWDPPCRRDRGCFGVVLEICLYLALRGCSRSSRGFQTTGCRFWARGASISFSFSLAPLLIMSCRLVHHFPTVLLGSCFQGGFPCSGAPLQLRLLQHLGPQWALPPDR